ncbi:hypothetical protein Pan258_29610 [Symmachiella dynata]|uniref:DUF2934 domain-containing protein n=1 Tax=Symmachiella dynata TaxID=2527995 RepID=UPI00118C1E90|nr:DUF2934 domain-containing protein [Symmachiella dynata]QDT48914.1 hypothetical protein Pan258_29610 [Symmachiella dynata]
MSVDSSQRRRWIKENAYFRWVDDGYPDGQAVRYWLKAESEYVFSTLEAELDTIRKRQLDDLLIHRHIFHQFADATQPYVGSQDGAILADWIARNYVAYAATAVRRMLDRRRDAHSLFRLVQEVRRNCAKFTRQRMRQKYVDNFPDVASQLALEKADEMFDYAIGRPGQQVLTRRMVEADILKLEQAAQAVTNIANSWITHDNRNPAISSLNFGDLNRAIDTLESVFCRYHALVTGNKPLLPRLDDFDCTKHFQKIWSPRPP